MYKTYNLICIVCTHYIVLSIILFITLYSLTVSHILSAPDSSWSGYKGRVTADFLQTHLPPSSDKLLICVCGPQPFTTAVTSAILEMDYPDSCLHVFD